MVMEDEGRNTPSPPPLLTWTAELLRLVAQQTCHVSACALQRPYLALWQQPHLALSRERQWQHQREL